MQMLIKKIFQQILRVIYPPHCTYCKEFLDEHAHILCPRCLAMIQPVVSCPLKITDAYEVTVFSIGAYTDPLKQLVLAKHYRDRLAARELGDLLWNLSDIKNVEFDYIIPVPLHWFRYASRWYNQAEEMAKVLSKKSNKPLMHVLRRSKQTFFQSGLSKEERMANIKDVFELVRVQEKYMNATILLVDDVLTTGATITAAVKVLRVLKPKKIIVGVGCRVI